MYCDRPRVCDGGDSMLDGFFHLLPAQRPIWRARSRETPNSSPSSSRVIGFSARRRATKMRRSRLQPK